MQAWIDPNLLQAASDFLELLVDFCQMAFTVFAVVAIGYLLAWLFPCKEGEDGKQ